jgi:protease IV
MSARRGLLLFLALVVVLGSAVAVVAVFTRRPAVNTLSSSVLVFDVPSSLEEDELPTRPFWGFRPSRPTLFDITSALRRAAEDDGVKALVLHVDDLDWGWAKITEVRDAVQAFRDAGKPVYASLSGGGEAEYLLATVADYVAVPPTATLQIDGLSASALFMRGTLDKIGVTPNFARAGRYKSATEQYTRGDMSEETREMLSAILADTWQVLVDSLATARGVSTEDMTRLVEEGPYWGPVAYERGLVDTLLYREDLDSLATHPEDEGELEQIPFTHYLGHAGGPVVGPRVALIHATGTIASGRSHEEFGGGRVVGSKTVLEALEEARAHHGIKAVVLRVDSPGGSGQASDEIWRAIERVRSEKPVVVSMSDLAASGGYYIAAGANRIVAQPMTITGSIGVFSGKLNILGLYRKLGLNVETIARGPHAEMLSAFHDFTPEEAALFERQVLAFYGVFIDRVARGRGLEPDSVDAVGQGRVWTGLSAIDRGLVDEWGGLDRAIDVAKELADLDPDEHVTIERLPRSERTFVERMLQQWFEEEEDTEAGLPIPAELRAWMVAARFPAGVTLALLPWSIEIR